MPTNALRSLVKRVADTVVAAPQDSDADLMGRFVASRDAYAFGELVRRHGPMVLGVCRRVTGDHHVAEDAFQAVFLVLARKAAGVRGESLASWLHGVASNVARKARRDQARRRGREKQVDTMPETSATITPSDYADCKKVIDEELAKLPERLREPILRCDIQGLERNEAAAQLRIRPDTLYRRLSEGRRLLADKLKRRGISMLVTGLGVALANCSEAVAKPLVDKTVRTALSALAGSAVSPSVAVLAAGVMKSMHVWKATTALLAVVALALTGVAVYPTQAAAVQMTPAATSAKETTRFGALPGGRHHQTDEATIPRDSPATTDPNPKTSNDPLPTETDPDRKAAEYVVSIGGAVQVNGLDTYFRKIGDLPPGMIRLRVVHLQQNAKLTDDGLRHLADCKHLTGLLLSDTRVGDQGLAYLKGLKDCENLSWIDLDNTLVGDAGVTHLKACKKLNHLDLWKSKVSRAMVDELKDALPDCFIRSHLRPSELSLARDRKAAEFVLSIGSKVFLFGEGEWRSREVGLPKTPFRVKSISLEGNQQLTDAGLANLAGCESVESLWLNSTEVGDVGVSHLRTCGDIWLLSLLKTKVTDAGLAHLKHLKSLTHLCLDGTKVSNVGLAHLKDCERLTQLELSHTAVSDEGLVHLKACKELKELRLRDTTVTAAGIADLGKSLPECQIEWNGGIVNQKK